MIAVLLSALFLTVSGPDSLNGLQAPTDSFSLTETSGTRDSLKLYRMKGLVVTASRTLLPLRAAPASVSVLENDSLLAGVSPSAQLSTLPGISLGSTGGLGSAISLSFRGGASNSVLYQLNGLPLNSAQNGGFDLNKLYDIQRVEIVRGPASSLYGANAASGVVNIITGGPVLDKPYSKVNFEKGSYKSQVWDVSVALPLAGWAWAGMGMTWKKNGGQRTNSDYDGTNYFLDLGAKPFPGIEAKFYYKEYKSECGSPGPDSSLYPEALRLWYQPTPNDRQYDKEKDINFKLSYQGQSFIAVSRNSIDNEFYSPSSGRSRNYTLQTNVDGQYNKILLPGLSTTIGGSYQLVTSEITALGKPEIRHQAGFLIQQYEPLQHLLLVGSARYDKDYAYPRQISPSISASYSFLNSYTAHISYAQGFRAPTLNELYFKDDAWLMYGNPGLKPEISRQTEAGLSADFGRFHVAVTNFLRKTSDLVVWQYDPSTWMTTAANLSKAVSQGFEMQAAATFWQRITISGNYTYCRSYQDTINQPKLSYKPENTANASLALNDFQIVPELKLGWKFWAQYSDIQNTGSYDPADHLPAFIISHQELSLKIVDARVYYRVENLFNADYQTRFGYPMPRRTHSFGVTLELWD